MALFACIMALAVSTTAGLSPTIKVGSLQAVVSTPTKGTQASIDTVKAANLAHIAALITPQAAGVQLIVTQELGEYRTFRREHQVARLHTLASRSSRSGLLPQSRAL
jgi:hypothetical protein